MPTYAFFCTHCRKAFEDHQSLQAHVKALEAYHGDGSHAAMPPCPRCQSSAQVEPRITTFQVHTSRKSV